jgi:hypothetical protein
VLIEHEEVQMLAVGGPDSLLDEKPANETTTQGDWDVIYEPGMKSNLKTAYANTEAVVYKGMRRVTSVAWMGWEAAKALGFKGQKFWAGR